VRQLQNFVEKLVILCEDGYQDHVFEELHAGLIKYSQRRERETAPEGPRLGGYVQSGPKEDEAAAIRRALSESRFSKTQTARRLGISRTTLWRKLREMEANVTHPGGRD